MSRDNFYCQSCSDNENNLNVHHLSYNPNCNIWEYANEDLITLCDKCHELTTKNVKKSISIIRKNAIDIVTSELYSDILELISGYDWEKLVKLSFKIKNL